MLLFKQIYIYFIALYIYLYFFTQVLTQKLCSTTPTSWQFSKDWSPSLPPLPAYKATMQETLLGEILQKNPCCVVWALPSLCTSKKYCSFPCVFIVPFPPQFFRTLCCVRSFPLCTYCSVLSINLVVQFLLVVLVLSSPALFVLFCLYYCTYSVHFCSYCIVPSRLVVILFRHLQMEAVLLTFCNV